MDVVIGFSLQGNLDLKAFSASALVKRFFSIGLFVTPKIQRTSRETKKSFRFPTRRQDSNFVPRQDECLHLVPALNVRADLVDLVRAQVQPLQVGDGQQAFRNLGQLVLRHVDVFEVNETFQVDRNVGQVSLRAPHVQRPQLRQRRKWANLNN